MTIGMIPPLLFSCKYIQLRLIANVWLIYYLFNSTVTSIVSILLVWSTLYEAILITRARRALRNKRRVKEDIVTDSSSGIGCTTYDLTSAVPNKNDLPIGIVIPRGMNNNNSDENLADSINLEEVKLSMYFSVQTFMKNDFNK